MTKRRASGGMTSDNEWDGRDGTDDRDEPASEVYAGGGSHVDKEAKGAMAGRKRGGHVQGYEDRLHETKNPTKRHEMEGGHRANEEEGHKEGGKVHPKDCACKTCKEKRKKGGAVHRMEGEGAKPRLDRKMRRQGGGVGSDTSPLTTAARTKDRKDGSEAAITGGM